jgi:molybdenum cofactor biosynthesis enzyme MoaA
MRFSLDTLDPFKFELITRRRGHEAVLKALDIALSSSLQSVKLNVVVIKGLNDSEIFDFVEMTRDNALSVRFIEFMPFTGKSSALVNLYDVIFMSRKQMGQGENGSLVPTPGTPFKSLSKSTARSRRTK